MLGSLLPGNVSNKEEKDLDDDELLHLEDSDTELQQDEDIGPVLQVKACFFRHLISVCRMSFIALIIMFRVYHPTGKWPFS